MQKLYKSLSHLFIVLFLGVMPNRPRFNFSFCILNSTFSIKVILLTFFLFTSSFSQAQWVAQMHSPKSAQTIAMGTDDAENVYVAGVFTDSLYLFSRDRAQQLSNITGTGLALSVSGWTLLTQKAVNNVFLCKYDSAGTLKWAKVLGTVNTQSEPRRNYLSLEADKAGNTYLFGYWNNNSTIPGFETTEKKPGLIKFDTQGERVWTKDIVPASAGFEGYLTKSTKDEELFLNISTNQAFTFGGEAFGQNTASTWAIDGATGVQRVVSNLPGASPMVVYPCGSDYEDGTEHYGQCRQPSRDSESGDRQFGLFQWSGQVQRSEHHGSGAGDKQQQTGAIEHHDSGLGCVCVQGEERRQQGMGEECVELGEGQWQWLHRYGTELSGGNRTRSDIRYPYENYWSICTSLSEFDKRWRIF